MKKSLTIAFGVLVLSTWYLVLSATAIRAEDEVVICPQPYGGGVVCGVKTHKPVDTGIADSLPLIASGFLGSSGLLAYFSRKLNKPSNL